MLKLNIKSRHYIPEFLTANLLLKHVIALDIDWSWKNFTSHNFCSSPIEQLIDLEKLRIENLKFRIDLPSQDQKMGGWSVTH